MTEGSTVAVRGCLRPIDKTSLLCLSPPFNISINVLKSTLICPVTRKASSNCHGFGTGVWKNLNLFSWARVTHIDPRINNISLRGELCGYININSIQGCPNFPFLNNAVSVRVKKENIIKPGMPTFHLALI